MIKINDEYGIIVRRLELSYVVHIPCLNKENGGYVSPINCIGVFTDCCDCNKDTTKELENKIKFIVGV